MKLRWKFISANKFLLFIQVATKLWFRKSLLQERFKSKMKFRYQIIVSAIKFRKKFCEVYDTDSLVKEVSELTVYCKCWSQ